MNSINRAWTAYTLQPTKGRAQAFICTTARDVQRVFACSLQTYFLHLTHMLLVLESWISSGTNLAPATFLACSFNRWRSWGMCYHLDLLHSSCSSCWCSWKALSSSNMRFHQCVIQLLQENSSSTQFSAVPALVYFSLYNKGIVCTHIKSCVSSCM